jgi:transcription-repair coupling factor (superfamily II helicase)
MQKARDRVRLQSDHRLVFKGDWDLPEERLKGVRGLVLELADIASRARQAA